MSSKKEHFEAALHWLCQVTCQAWCLMCPDKCKCINEHNKESHQWSMVRGGQGKTSLQSYAEPNKKRPSKPSERKDKLIMFRLRSEYIQLNQHVSIGIKNANFPLCPCTEVSVAYNLFDCQALSNLKAEFLQLNHDPQNTLYGEEEQLELKCKYHIMAKRSKGSGPLTSGSVK